MKDGVCKIYSTEIGTYTISSGEYSTMLICPYFGQFSTDIYSGVLKVKCIEIGGADKTCQVRSCDDSYNFTDDYSLTQTFDGSLELTFLGIPTGKYLITVDEKYRFYKEIISIQNINEIDVELKQWLYKNGDQCEWNTGGWMKCQIYNKSKQAYVGSNPTPFGSLSVTQSIDFLSNGISYKHSSLARGQRQGIVSGISRIDTALYAGTVKHNPIDIMKYNRLVTDAKDLKITLRSGEKNNANTNGNTLIVLASSNAPIVDLNMSGANASVVIGANFYDAGYGYNPPGSVTSLDYTQQNSTGVPVPAEYRHSIDTTVTQIYLI